MARSWGFNTFGQLGLGDTMSRGVYRWELGDDLPAVNLGGRAVHVAAGGWHTCVVLDTGEVKCFGSNRDGRLGLGDEIFRGWEPEDMGAALPPVDLGSGVGASAVHAAMGGWSTCALLRDKSVKW